MSLIIILLTVTTVSSAPIGWEGGGNHEVAGKGYVNSENSQMASIGAIFTSTYHTKQLNPWTNSSASHVINYSYLSACQGVDGAISRSSEHSWTSDKPQKQATAKAASFQH